METIAHRLYPGMLSRRTILIFACVFLIRFPNSADAHSVTLAWDASGDPNLAGYNVYRSENSGIFTSVPLNGASLLTTNSFTDSAVQSDRIYYYTVTAVSTKGIESTRSAEVAAETADSGDAAIGYTPLESADGVTARGFTIIGYHHDGVLISETVFPTSPLIRSGRVYAEVKDSVNTGIAISNANPDAVTLDFYFTDADGAKVYSGSTALPANTQVVVFLNEPPLAPPTDVNLRAVRTFTFSASLPMTFTAVRTFVNERFEFLITRVPIAALDSPVFSSIAVPYYADGGQWKSRIVLVNSTDHPISGAIEFLRDNATGSDGTASGDLRQTYGYMIPSGSATVVETPRSESELFGWVRVNSSEGAPSPSVMSLDSFEVDGITVRTSGTAAIPESSEFRVYAEASGTFGEAGSVRTGIAISNAGRTPLVMRLDLLRLDGVPTGLYENVAVPAIGQVTLFWDQFAGFESLKARFQGLLKITGAPVAVVGLKKSYNERGDSLITTIPALAESAFAAGPERLFFAQGAGYETQFVVAIP